MPVIGLYIDRAIIESENFRWVFFPLPNKILIWEAVSSYAFLFLYRKQITALEMMLEKQEKRMVQEREELERETVERIARIKVINRG